MKPNHDPRQNRSSFLSSIVLFLILAFSLAMPQSAYAQGDAFGGTTWYVATTGNDSNSCNVVGSPCLTINGAIGKAADGDTVKVAVGTYTNAGTGFGSEVARIMKSVTLLGGWNAAFTAQSGVSTIDGQGLSDHNGIYTSDFADPNITVSIDRFTITNATQGIHNGGRSAITISNSTFRENDTGIFTSGPGLTLSNSSVIGNGLGIGVSSGDAVVVNNSTISGNAGTGISYSGAFAPFLTINNSAINSNTGGGITLWGSVFSPTSVNINNSTIVNNIKTAIDGGGGIRLYNSYAINLIINNSTISGNSATSGGGIYNEGVINTLTMHNTILANNTAPTAPDCSGLINTSHHNIISNTSGCTVTAGVGDKFNVNPLLNTYLIGTPAYLALLSGSPAINAGNSATCLSTDQRGVIRPQGGTCDLGAFEYTTPGAATTLLVASGNNQSTSPTSAFPLPLKAIAVDSLGSPVPSVDITFTAPSSGASGTFTSTGTSINSVNTDTGGVATTSTFTANNQVGTYIVSASASGAGSVNFNLQNLTWFVSPTGDDINSCTSVAAPCLTIDGAINKAAAGDTIKVSGGTYTSTTDFVVHINKNITLSGGWDPTFTSRSSKTIINGQNARSGIANTAPSAVTLIEYFQIRNGYSCAGSGIFNYGSLTLQNSTILNNKNSPACGAGGGGIYSYGALIIKNSTISGNISHDGGGIYAGGSVDLNNVTLTNNSSTIQGGGIYVESGTVTIRNTILAGNTALIGPDCNSTISSSGYNLIGNNSGCTFSAATGDLVGTSVSPINPLLTPLQNNGGPTLTHALISGGPAIDAGNPAFPGSGGNACLATDQRGITRPIGSTCDIGAFEGYITFVTSINRLDPNPTSASIVNYLVTFTEPVTGVDLSDFALAATGTTGASITSVSGSDDTYTVTVNTGSGNGNGAIRLKLIDDDSILDSSSNPLGGAGAGNGNFTTGEVYTLRRIPTTISPTDSTIDTTPTYRWSKLNGATKYQYQLVKGTTVIYNKVVPASACSASTCVSAPARILATGNYRWRVRAMIGGVWKNYSPYKSFVISPAKPGFWNNPGLEFYVTNTTPKVDNFAIYIYVNGCGSYKITHTPLVPIAYSNKQFNFAGSFYANGTFITPTVAQGTLGLSSFYIPGCGYLTGGPFSWTATWKNGNQPDVVLNEGDIPEFTLTPESTTPFDLFTIDPEK